MCARHSTAHAAQSSHPPQHFGWNPSWLTCAFADLGRSGLKLAPIGLGTDNFANPVDEATAHALLDRATAAGINLVDTSNSYGGQRFAGESERFIGRWLQRNGRSGARRHSIVLATKVFYPAGPGPNDRSNSRRHIIQACEDSLRRLQTDRIDLYQLHRPSPEIPIEETLYALDTLVRDGKVLYIGTTTHPAWQVMEALHVSRAAWVGAFCLGTAAVQPARPPHRK